MKQIAVFCLCLLVLLFAGCDSNASDPSDSTTDGSYVMNPTGLFFDGVTKISVPHAEDLFLGDGSYTIQTWIKVGQLTDYFQDIIVKGTTYPNIDYDLGIDRFNQFHFWSNQDGVSMFDDQTIIEPGRYYNVAVVSDRDDGTVKLYVNGLMMASDVLVETFVNVPNRLLIGGHNTEDLPKSQNWNGIIYNVAIWDFAMKGNEVKDAMYKNLTGTEQGLVVCWKLDEGSGKTVKDLTGKHDGTVLGNANWVAMPY